MKKKHYTTPKSSKKAVVITWCLTSLNYGEMLQAYAVQSVLRKFGVEAVTISYLDNATRQGLKKNTIYKENAVGYWRFKNFVKKYMNPVIQCSTKEEVEQESRGYDYYICGSDQIWNPASYDKDGIYTLNFGKRSVVRISYAPSMGVNKILRTEEKTVANMVKNLQKLDFISVRETVSKEILESRVEKDIAVVLDPTLLVPYKEWAVLASKRKNKGKYAFVYVLGKIDDTYTELIHSIATMYQVESIVWLSVIKNEHLAGKNVKKVVMASPEDFLSYVRFAEVVITDSFHGLMFSVKFQNNFFVLDRKYGKKNMAGDPRLDDIMDRLNITGRKVKSVTELKNCKKNADYVTYKGNYIKEREKSFAFLQKALGGE